MEKLAVENWKHTPLQRRLNSLASVLGTGGNSPLTSEKILNRLTPDRNRALFSVDPTLTTRLSVVLAELEKKGLTALGRSIFRTNFTRSLENYSGIALAWEREGQARKLNPAPWVIVGFQRSGTTFLQQLLSQSPASQGMPFWKVLSPDPGLPDWRKRIRASEATFLNRWVNPESEVIHEILPKSFEECWWLFGHQIGTLCFDFHFCLPKIKKLLETQSEKEGLYDRYVKMLPYISGRDDQRPFVLKAPDHLWRLEELYRVFPQARVVWMHREPIDSITSFSALSAMHRRAVLGNVDPLSVGPHVSQTFHEGVASAMKFRADHPEKRIYDLRYSELVRDPVAAVAQLHSFFQDSATPEAGTEFARYLDRDPHRKKAKHVYSPEVYGLDPGTVREKFSEYRDAYLSQ